MTAVEFTVTWIGTVLLPGLSTRSGIVAFPMKVPATAMSRVTLPMANVMTVGLGMKTVPSELPPSGRDSFRRWKEVTFRPARPLKPGTWLADAGNF